MSKLALIVKTRTQPGKRDEVRQLFEKHLAPRALANDAQEVVVWCDDDNNADTFYLFEIYRDREAFHANAQAASEAAWFEDYMKQAQPLLSGQPEVVMATPRWAKGATLGEMAVLCASITARADMAEEVTNPWARAETLAGLARLLPDGQRMAVLVESLQAARGCANGWRRAQALAAVSQQWPP